MVGNLPITDNILQTGQLVREHTSDQVLCLHSKQMRLSFFSALKTAQRQRTQGIPAPTDIKHGCGKQGLDKQIAHRFGIQKLSYILQRKAMGCAQRKYDRILGRRRL